VPETPKGQAFVGDPTYEGPVIASVDMTTLPTMIWVANGTRSTIDAFRQPGLVAVQHPKLWLTASIDETAVDLFIEELRKEELRDEQDDLWVDDDEVRVRPSAAHGPGDTGAIDEECEHVEVRVLGPVEISGWKQAPQRAVVTELACYLVLHADRPVPADELRAAIWPDDAREASAKSLRTYMSLLRKACGPENVPTGTAAGYRIGSGVVSDWAQFQLLTRADAPANQLRSALEMVRGRPFSGVPANSFGWVFSELLVSQMEVAISEVARRLAADPEALDTTWAIQQGLRAVPTDFGLWELRLSTAEIQGGGELARARREAEAALGGDAADLFGHSGST
jgi:hypothetical protein